MNKLYPQLLIDRYGIDSYKSDVLDYIDIIAKKRGALIKGGEVDYDKTYKLIIKDLKDGKLGNITFDRI